MIRLALIFVLGLGFMGADAQNKKRALSPSIGYVRKLDPYETTRNGIHLGINMYRKNARRFSSDAQLSANLTGNRENSFSAINALFGARYYFMKPEKSARLFTNLLAGATFTSESGGDFIENIFRPGYSLGLYLEINDIVFGTAIESPENFFVKVGYVLR